MNNSAILRKRVFHASSWVVGGHALSQMLRLASNLIMTRILVPEMFGIMAIANIVLIGLAMMSDVGIRQNIVQSKNSDSENFLNTAWVVQIIRGFFLWVVALFISYILSEFIDSNFWELGSVYANPVLPYVIAVLSFNAILNGFESTNLAMANRNLALNKVVKIELAAQFLGILFMVGWVIVDKSIWALVSGSLVSSLVKLILSHTSLPGHRNKFYFDKTSFHEIFHFGKWVFVTSILGFLSANTDRLILGGLVDSTTLGLYVIAYFIINSFQQVITKLIGNVAFPALSEVVRQRPHALRVTYYKFRAPIDVVILFITGFLFAAGHFFIQLLYDDRYLAAGPMLEILCVSLFTLRFSLAGQCFMALGKPKLLSPIILIRVIMLSVFIPLAFNWWGLDGALWVVATSDLFTLPLTLYFKLKYNLLVVWREIVLLPLLVVGYIVGVYFTTIISALGIVV